MDIKKRNNNESSATGWAFLSFSWMFWIIISAIIGAILEISNPQEGTFMSVILFLKGLPISILLSIFGIIGALQRKD